MATVDPEALVGQYVLVRWIDAQESIDGPEGDAQPCVWDTVGIYLGVTEHDVAGTTVYGEIVARHRDAETGECDGWLWLPRQWVIERHVLMPIAGQADA
jgi:hypothetical protein